MGSMEFLVDITDIALPTDHGVARKNGCVIFVPGAVIGDRVKVTLARQQRQFSYGELTDIETPSPFRVNPECPHFGICGGCSLQHVHYNKQLEIKEHFLSENLRRIGGIDVKNTNLLPVRPSPDIYLYRNKLELSFGDKDGKIALGMRERVSPFRRFTARVVPIETCIVFSRAIEKIIPVVTELASQLGLAPFSPFTKKGVLKHLILRESKATGHIMAILETRRDGLPNLESAIQSMIKEIPEVVSFYHGVNTRTDDVIRFDRLHHLYGAEAIEDKIGNLTAMVYPGTFLQPNTRGAELLYETILEQLKVEGNETVLGLYCGSGPIEIYVAQTARHVTGIDSDPKNISTANENCSINHVTNCTFYAGRAEDALRRTLSPTPSALIIDPPRTGLSKQSLDVVEALNLPKIAYVSCNPATLARDLRELVSHGYSVQTISPFDLFPHTGHLETLTILLRS